MKSSRTTECNCPACGAPFDSASSVFGDHLPQAGDASLCIKCGTTLIFNPDLTLRLANVVDWSIMPQEMRRRLNIAQEARRATKVMIDIPFFDEAHHVRGNF